MSERIAELFSSMPDVKPVARIEIPSRFDYPPFIVFYGERAFQRILRRPSVSGDVFTFMEVECWRAPDPGRENAIVAGE
jgi:hypothetical protein